MISTFSFEELKIQMDKGQTIHKNRALAHNLQQPAQEANFLPILTSPGDQLLSFSQTCKNSDHYLYSTMEGYLKPSLFSSIKVYPPLPAFESLPKVKWWWLIFCYNKLQTNSFKCSQLAGILIFPVWMG